MIEKLSHPINGEKYKSVIDKYGDNKYSFIIMNNLDINTQNYCCYDENDEYEETMWESGYCDTEIFIVPNIRNLFLNLSDDDNKDGDDEFFVIIRVCRESNSFGFGGSNISYPQKLWITNKTTVKDIIDKYINNDKYILDLFILNGFKLSINDNIYQKFIQNNQNKKVQTKKVWIRLTKQQE